MIKPDWRVLERALTLAQGFVASLPERSVAPRADGEALLAVFDELLPDDPTDATAVIERLARDADAGLTAIPSGRFFGWVMGGGVPAAVAADWLTSVWDQNAGSVEGTPAAAVVERVAVRWMLDLLDLPRHASAALVTGAQMANFVGLCAARDQVLRAAGWDVAEEGLAGAPPLAVVIGAERHGAVDKALRFLGIGARRITVIDTDERGRMRGDLLARALAGVRGPAIVCAQVGNVNGGGIDPMPAIADAVDELRGRAGAEAVWLHVDGAFGLWARASTALRALVDGVERADSWATDAHKWLNTPYDCGIAFTAHPAAHRRALGLRATYLPEVDDAAAIPTPFDFTPELSRRARGFAVWAGLRQLGRRGVAEIVDRTTALAARFAALLAEVPGAAIAVQTLNQVVVLFRDPGGRDNDAHTRAVIRRLLASGVCYVTPTVWRGAAAMRISVSNFTTDEEDVRRSVAAMVAAHRESGE